MACVVAGLVAAGCGGGEEEPAGPTVTQRITERFGQELLDETRAPLAENGNVLRLLRRDNEAATSERGDVISIDGRVPSDTLANDETWVLNVNGVEADETPPKYRLFDGDVVQWDLRDWYVTLDVRATVGAFPETFTRGVFGKRFPVTVECEKPESEVCERVERTLRDAGVHTDGRAPRGGLPPRGQPQRAKILVGRWEHWRNRTWPSRIDAGPRYSGVFARFGPGGRSLRLLNWNGHRVRHAGAGAGLVAAMRPTEEDLTWFVTGVDDVGVARAADALKSDALRDAFAVAVTERGVEKLPLKAPKLPETVDPRNVDLAPYRRSRDEQPRKRPLGPPVGGLAIDDLRVGDGDRATQGATAVVSYVGYVYSSGRWRPYSSSYGPAGKPLVFTLGRDGVIRGFSRGVRGMRVGGVRTVSVPPRLGYGEAGDPPRVGPRDTLMFLVTLEAVPRP